VIDSFAYIIGGKTDSAAAIAEVWTYNLYTDQWQQKADLPFGNRWRASASSNSTDGFLAFGLDESLNYHDELYRYQPNLDQWTKISDFPKGGRNYVKMHHINGKLICIAGYDSTAQFLNEVWSYNLNRSIWDSLPALPSSGRRGGISFQSSSAIYYTTGLGANGVRFKESWKLEDPTKLNEFGHEQGRFVRVYPNPAKAECSLIVGLGNVKQFDFYRIYDVNGKQILHGSLQNRQLIDLQNLNKGVYFLMVKVNKEVYTRKLIKY
jgi:N-acetylneuraminic acid mutarotase